MIDNWLHCFISSREARVLCSVAHILVDVIGLLLMPVAVFLCFIHISYHAMLHLFKSISNAKEKRIY